MAMKKATTKKMRVTKEPFGNFVEEPRRTADAVEARLKTLTKKFSDPGCDCVSRSWYGSGHDTMCPVSNVSIGTTEHSIRLQHTELQRLSVKARIAAVALAEVWDVVRGIELTHQAEINGVEEFIGMLAGQTTIPADASQMTEEDVINGLDMLTTEPMDAVE